MGIVFGVLFGVIDVDSGDNGDVTHKFELNLIYSLPLGAIVGGIIGFLNQWIRSSPRSQYSTIESKGSEHL